MLFLDEAKNYAGLLINILADREKVLEYVTKTYTNVQIFAEGTWLRLDFNNDGTVSMDDVRKSLASLYEFLRNFDYI